MGSAISLVLISRETDGTGPGICAAVMSALRPGDFGLGDRLWQEPSLEPPPDAPGPEVYQARIAGQRPGGHGPDFDARS